MFNQTALFITLFAPVFTYLAGAMIFSLVERLRKGSALAKYQHHICYRNGL